jgi:hypothetical protein
VALPDMDVGLLHVALQIGVTQLVLDFLMMLVEFSSEFAGASRR